MIAQEITKKDLKEGLEKTATAIVEVVDSRFKQVDARFDQLEKRMDMFDAKLDKLINLLEHFLKRPPISKMSFR